MNFLLILWHEIGIRLNHDLKFLKRFMILWLIWKLGRFMISWLIWNLKSFMVLILRGLWFCYWKGFYEFIIDLWNEISDFVIGSVLGLVVIWKGFDVFLLVLISELKNFNGFLIVKIKVFSCYNSLLK